MQNFNTPTELNQAIIEFAEYYNHDRYQYPMDNLTTEDIYFARVEEVHSKTEKSKKKTIKNVTGSI